jgi:2,5-diamino-6-(ribosylamino)-4(3H)-pyrimidinone 5'-phosphate reductase
MKDQGLGPWIIVRKGQKLLHSEKSKIVERVRGEVIEIESDYLDDNNNFQWNKLFKLLHKKGLKSVMVEGGATIINQLLDPFNSNCIHSLIITIGPVYLGSNGVQVSPNGRVDLKQVKWWHGIQDSILCAKVN